MTGAFSAIRDYSAAALKHPAVKRAAWALAGIGALDLLLLALFFGPAAWRHARLEDEIAGERRARLEAMHGEETAADYARLSKAAMVLGQKWRKNADQAGLVESLGRLSAQCGLKVVSQDFIVTDSKGGGKVFKQNLSLTGGYAGLRKFLKETDSLPNLTVVEQARFERAEGKGDGVRATLEIWTFSRPAGKGAS